MSAETLLWGLVIALLIAVGLLLILVIGLLRSYADIVKALHDAGVRLEEDNNGPGAQTTPVPRRGGTTGKQAPALSGETLEGGVKAITVTGAEGHLLVAFLSSGCGTCMDFWRVLRSYKGRIPRLDAQVVVVTKGPEREEPGKLTELAGDRVEVLMSDESWNAYDIPMTPHFVLVDRVTGTVIGEGSTSTPESLAELMGRAAADARNVTRRELLTRRPAGGA